MLQTMIPNSQLIFLPLRGKKRVEKKSVLGDGHLVFTEIIAPSKINSLVGSANAKSLPMAAASIFVAAHPSPYTSQSNFKIPISYI